MRQNGSMELARSRSIGQIVQAALRLAGAYPFLFLILAAAVMVPYDLAFLAVTGRGPLGHGHESFASGLPWQVLSFSLIGPLISAVHVHAVVTIGQGGRPRLSQVALKGLRVLPVVSAAEIVANIGIIAGTFALLLPGILLALRWSVVAQAAALESEGWIPALQRSARLAAGHYWHIFGLLFVVGVPTFAIRLGMEAIPAGSTAGAGSVVLGTAVDTVLASFAALTLAVLYFDLRAREHGASEPAGEGRQPADFD